MSKVLKSIILALATLSLTVLSTQVHAAGRKLTSAEEKQLICLAKNIYHEARSEPEEGQKAVAEVTLKRLASKRWGTTICEVVYSRKQFSWTLTKPELPILEPDAWAKAWNIAFDHWSGQAATRHSNDTMFYLNPNKIEKLPEWALGMYVVALVGNHWFLSSERPTDTNRPMMLAQHGSILPES